MEKIIIEEYRQEETIRKANIRWYQEKNLSDGEYTETLKLIVLRDFTNSLLKRLNSQFRV